jgi:hypothetical protein
MRLILKFLTILVIFIYSLLFFLPKENIYYFALQKLHNEKIDIKTKNIEDKYIGINLKNNIIKYEGIKVATIEGISFKTLFFKTDIKINDFKVQKSLKRFLPFDMKCIEISHNILNPLVIDIKLSKQFDIKDKNIMKYLTKTSNGYRYEYKF